jgi:hypothetical protein
MGLSKLPNVTWKTTISYSSWVHFQAQPQAAYGSKLNLQVTTDIRLYTIDVPYAQHL